MALAQEHATDTGLTTHQRAQLYRAYLAQHNGANDGWVRSRTRGEQATLASLQQRGYMVQRAFSGAGTASPAYEYRLHPIMHRAMHESALAHQVANGQSAVYRGNDYNRKDGMSAEAGAAQEAPNAEASNVTSIDKKAQASGTSRGGTGRRSGGGKGKPKPRAKPKPGGKPKPRAAATGSKPKPAGTGKPRAVKASKEAKAAQAKMAEHAAGYKAYTDAQTAKAKAVAAGDEKEVAKQQKIMDKQRPAYTARRAAYREYQAAPA